MKWMAIRGSHGLEVVIQRRWLRPRKWNWHIHVDRQCLARGRGMDDLIRAGWAVVGELEKSNKTAVAGELRSLVLVLEEER